MGKIIGINYKSRLRPFKVSKKKKEKSYRTLGITNIVDTPNTDYSNRVMFYDYDLFNRQKIPQYDLDLIKSKFPNDILLFKSTKGIHFVSLTLDLTNENPRDKALNISREMGQDYANFEGFFDYDYLTLRIAAKFSNKTNKIHKPKPHFFKWLRKPKRNSLMSSEHLNAYYRLGLPYKIYSAYTHRCRVLDTTTRYYYYFTNQ